MIEGLGLVIPTGFGLAAVLYLWLAVRVSRASTESSNNTISYFLFLIGTMIAGSAFTCGATDANIYGIGRTLTFFSAGFLPVVLYAIYRNFTIDLIKAVEKKSIKKQGDYPGVYESIRGVRFIEAVVKSSRSKDKWVKV